MTLVAICVAIPQRMAPQT